MLQELLNVRTVKWSLRGGKERKRLSRLGVGVCSYLYHSGGCQDGMFMMSVWLCRARSALKLDRHHDRMRALVVWQIFRLRFRRSPGLALRCYLPVRAHRFCCLGSWVTVPAIAVSLMPSFFKFSSHFFEVVAIFLFLGCFFNWRCCLLMGVVWACGAPYLLDLQVLRTGFGVGF